jgi:hypothetical protein
VQREQPADVVHILIVQLGQHLIDHALREARLLLQVRLAFCCSHAQSSSSSSAAAAAAPVVLIGVWCTVSPGVKAAALDRSIVEAWVAPCALLVMLRLAEATGPVRCSEGSLQTGSVSGGAGTAAATVAKVRGTSRRLSRRTVAGANALKGSRIKLTKVSFM